MRWWSAGPRAQTPSGPNALRKCFPRYACFVARPEQVGRDFVRSVHQSTRRLDDDPYTDTFWGILTGYDAANALEIAARDRPLVVRKVGAGTEFAMEMVTEGIWCDELAKNKTDAHKMVTEGIWCDELAKNKTDAHTSLGAPPAGAHHFPFGISLAPNRSRSFFVL